MFRNVPTCADYSGIVSVLFWHYFRKSYTITHEGKERYTALRDVMAQKAKKLFSLRGGTTKQPLRGGTTKQVIARRNDEASHCEELATKQ